MNKTFNKTKNITVVMAIALITMAVLGSCFGIFGAKTAAKYVLNQNATVQATITAPEQAKVRTVIEWLYLQLQQDDCAPRTVNGVQFAGTEGYNFATDHRTIYSYWHSGSNRLTSNGAMLDSTGSNFGVRISADMKNPAYADYLMVGGDTPLYTLLNDEFYFKYYNTKSGNDYYMTIYFVNTALTASMVGKSIGDVKPDGVSEDNHIYSTVYACFSQEVVFDGHTYAAGSYFTGTTKIAKRVDSGTFYVLDTGNGFTITGAVSKPID